VQPPQRSPAERSGVGHGAWWPEALTASTGVYRTTNPHVKAIAGDFSAFRWGVQINIPLTLIEYGDPDGSGDLQRKNEIAIRSEVVYGVGILSTDAFAVVKDTDNDGS
jgi:hypothetical protein